MANSVEDRPASTAALGPLSSLPGPRPLPLLGNLAQIDLGHMHLQFEQWAQDYRPGRACAQALCLGSSTASG